MKSWFYHIVRGSLFVICMFGIVHDAFAQSTQTISIRDGKVFVDGQIVPAQMLPASLDIRGLEMQFSYTGDFGPVVFPVNGKYYRFDGNRIVEATGSLEESNGLTVFFREKAFAPGRTEAAPGQRRIFDVVPEEAVSAPPGVMVVRQPVEVLQRQAEELRRLSEEIEQHREQEMAGMADQVRDRAQQITFIAEQLPRVEVQNYLSDVQRYDQSLYRKLVREQELEARTQMLATQIRGLTNPTEYRDKMAELRRQLEQIFELKQENRRNEIRHLEEQLQQLRQDLENRQRLRESIIERRIIQLTGRGSDSDK